jgi:hypothetical protein
MDNYVFNRDTIIAKLREELLGPAPAGEELDCTKPVIFKSVEETYTPFYQKENGEEILHRDNPTSRYGAGRLCPLPPPAPETKDKLKIDENWTGKITFEETEPPENFNDVRDETSPEESAPPESDDSLQPNHSNLAAANKYQPHSMGVSFLAEVPKGSQVIVTVSGGRYRKLPVLVGKKSRTWWRREPVEITAKFKGIEYAFTAGNINPDYFKPSNTDGLDLSVELSIRPTQKSNQYLMTAILVNRTIVLRGLTDDECSLFQSEFTVRVVSPGGNEHILPYPQIEYSQLSEEDRSINLLYRRMQNFAVGHGCAADWDKEVGDSEKVKKVVATQFPVYEAPPITSEIRRADGTLLEISMAKLGGLIEGEDGMSELVEMREEYDGWINRRTGEIQTLPVQHHYIANLHLSECRAVRDRIRDGIDFLNQNDKALAAFQLANHAILIQQHRSKAPLRDVLPDENTGEAAFSRKIVDPDLTSSASGLGKWRPFQIAFLLMALRSAVDPASLFREMVELIWFPTAGGKTECYLALAAFSIFYRRLNDPDDFGTHVFMRYTLRLLTAQQFQRAVALVCAMEYLRRQNPNALGTTEFSIGLWLGNDVTPGSGRDALQALKSLEKHPHTAQNKFILNRCPWCSVRLGKVETIDKNSKKGNQYKKTIKIIGYRKVKGSVGFHCPDPDCLFHAHLPVYVTDQDIYEKRPTMYIATVDKFAILAWKPAARALFGIDRNGNRIVSPPGLILIDEVHLLTGPLGTVIALYEPVVEELCTDRRRHSGDVNGEKPIRPKIICSTATTRCYKEQIRALFGREDAQLFPPPGLDAGNSFFARYARDEKGNLLPGKKYVGINAPGLGSLQNTETRTYTALLQASAEVPMEGVDCYWTLMIFFNNLKMLGNTISLFQSNVQSYFLTYKNRTGLKKIRRIKAPLELTGRLSSDEVTASLQKLEIQHKNQDSQAVDACVFSSIGEVGVDVGRLSTEVIVGQPKTTAQYIQVAGRVGRNAKSPGIIVTIYSPSNSRDRSHFECHRSFHERLYAQVEPASLTPFSPPALERVLHAVMAAYVRQTGSIRQASSPYPFPENEIKTLKNILLARLQQVSPELRAEFERVFDRRVTEWRRWERTSWSGNTMSGEASDALLRPFETWTEESDEKRSWATPTSMRNVDAESEFRITHFYQSLENSEE